MKTIARPGFRNVLLLVVSLGTWFVFSPLAAIAESQAIDALEIQTRQHGSRIEFYVENRQAYDITMELSVDMTNMTSSGRTPLTETIAPGASKRVLSIEAAKSEPGWGFSYQYQWIRGAVDAEHDADHIYRMPYENGQKFRVVQGYGGETSHQKDSKYAIDFAMPEGTPIVAARGGEVVSVYERSNTGGPSRKYAHLGNHVIIRHADRTLGEYLHLKQYGADVEVGDVVDAGQVIGYSGNTGYSTGPHLHFGVYSAKDGKTRKTHALKFEHTQGIATTVETGGVYIAK